MCGIVAYVGRKQAAPILLRGLSALEYRGYDSAGIAVMGERLSLVKRVGRVSSLAGAEQLTGTCGVGHTRWATHGAPTEENAHPHVFGKVAVVHNGIIENADVLKAECTARGEKFSSETDSEVIAHLLNFYFKGDLLAALKETCKRLVGSYAIAAMGEEREIVLARRASPLLVGRGEDGAYAASDLSALSACQTVYALGEGHFARMTEDAIRIFDDGGKIALKPLKKEEVEGLPAKGGYAHFMKKELMEIPASIANSLENYRSFAQNQAFCRVLCQTEYLTFLGCGTAYHSGLCAKYAVERLARVRAACHLSSEYRYLNPIVKRGELVVAISQSGETADTLAAAELAKAKGAILLAVTNVGYSTLSRIADFCLVTGAGREVAVAATKSFSAQLAVLFSFAADLARLRGMGERDLGNLPVLAERTLAASEGTKAWTGAFVHAKNVFFLGRGADVATAMEGSLKLKEIAYLPSEGYAAGELKHGPLALVEQGTPVVAVMTEKALAEKTKNAVHETAARGANVFVVSAFPPEDGLPTVEIPEADEAFSPILAAIPLQMLAYYVSLARGYDPDLPRNLAKSVTVE